jgi:hypothetical protein
MFRTLPCPWQNKSTIAYLNQWRGFYQLTPPLEGALKWRHENKQISPPNPENPRVL